MRSFKIPRILLQPIGYVDKEILTWVGENIIHKISVSIKIAEKYIPLKRDFLDTGRGQYIAEPYIYILSNIDEKYDKVLGIADVDAYSYGYNFIFGIAGHRSAIVFLKRLRPEFWGENPDPNKFLNRVLKECLHELGHTFGLTHCSNPRCVMRFSNTIMDTDFKEAAFCLNCSRKFKSKGIEVYEIL